MSKPKKKPNTQQNQKHLAAQNRANFFHKMKIIIDSVCGTDIFPLIPKSVMEDLYLCRSASFKIKPEPTSDLTINELKDSKILLINSIKDQKITLPPANIEISLNDYYTIVITILLLYVRISNTLFPQADRVKAELQKIIRDDATNISAGDSMNNILYSYSLAASDLSKLLFFCRYDRVFPKTVPALTENIIYINYVKPETIKVILNEGTRPAIRVGWAFPNTGAEWISIKPSVLGMNSPFAEIPLKVYVQSHALNRLIERIDCFILGTVHFNMFLSLKNPKIAYDTNNNLLIEYTFFGIKAGYFRADIVEGIILLRTFLFITNSGTPEGQLLEKNTGLQKLDKKYLSIDKLSTFMNSNLDQSPEIQQLFKNSDCKCLIDLFNNTKCLLTKKDNHFNFDQMSSYLNSNKMDMLQTNHESEPAFSAIE